MLYKTRRRKLGFKAIGFGDGNLSIVELNYSVLLWFLDLFTESRLKGLLVDLYQCGRHV